MFIKTFLDTEAFCQCNLFAYENNREHIRFFLIKSVVNVSCSYDVRVKTGCTSDWAWTSITRIYFIVHSVVGVNAPVTHFALAMYHGKNGVYFQSNVVIKCDPRFVNIISCYADCDAFYLRSKSEVPLCLRIKKKNTYITRMLILKIACLINFVCV